MTTMDFTVFDLDFPAGSKNVHWLHSQFPELRLDIKRTIAEADFVVTHSNLHLKPGNLGMAVADFWRVADGKIVEHWDVVQQVPDKSANNNTMF